MSSLAWGLLEPTSIKLARWLRQTRSGPGLTVPLDKLVNLSELTVKLDRLLASETTTITEKRTQREIADFVRELERIRERVLQARKPDGILYLEAGLSRPVVPESLCA